jgi:hypothetical protein
MTSVFMNHSERYWIAINGSSCALSAIPLRNPIVTPTPQHLLGFPTLEEAERAQHICLTAAMEEVNRFLRNLAPDIKSGRIRAIREKRPQPETTGPTTWSESV